MLRTAYSSITKLRLMRNKTMARYSFVKVQLLLKEQLSRFKYTSGWSISRILSSGLPCGNHLCSHLSGRGVTTLLDAAYPGLASPTRGKGTCEDEPSPIVHRRFRPCLALLPAGVTWPHALLRAPVVSYTTFSPSRPHPTQG